MKMYTSQRTLLKWRARSIQTKQKLRGIVPDGNHPNNIHPFLKKINSKRLQQENRKQSRASALISDRKRSAGGGGRRSSSNVYINKGYQMTQQKNFFLPYPLRLLGVWSSDRGELLYTFNMNTEPPKSEIYQQSPILLHVH
jgi:hypothetical protein